MAQAVVVDSRLRIDEAAAVVSRLRRLGRDQVSTLDLRPLDSIVTDSTHLDLAGVALLTNCLLTSERRRPLLVQMPSSDRVLRQLARGGLWFALAQRGETAIEAEPQQGSMFAVPSSIADLQAWANRWDPADSAFRSRVWGVDDRDPGRPIDTVQSDFVAFVNPHFSVGRDRLVRELNENVARTWLDRLAATDTTFVSSATEIVTELLYNFTAHPFSTLTSRPPLKRDVPLDRRFGLVILFTTSGGGGDKLHISVFDTGHGIPATLRPKFSRRIRDTLGDDFDLVRGMLNGTLPPYGRGEGRGFPRLIDLARRYGGTVHLMTSSDFDLGDTLLADLSYRDSLARVESLPQCDVAGTLVRVTLALQRRAPSTDDDDLDVAALTLT